MAAIYDQFNDLSVYEDWLDYSLNYLDGEDARVIDLACGTGWFTELMSPHVGSVLGIDLDPQMIAAARRETQAYAADRLRFQTGDMTALELADKSVDLVTCYLDSLCFLPGLDQVEAAFCEAYRILKPGAYYLFDVWTPHQLSEGFHNYNYAGATETAALIWDSFLEPDLTVVHELTLFGLDEDSGRYDRYEVDLTERTYPLAAYLTALEAAGFQRDQIQVSIDHGQESYDPERHSTAERWFFACRK